MGDNWVPITLFICITFIITAAIYFRTKQKEKVQETLKYSIDKGQALSAEVIDSMLVANKPFEDLKKGVILFSLGLAIIVFALITGRNHINGLVGIGSIPIMLGIGYFVIWKLRLRLDK